MLQTDKVRIAEFCEKWGVAELAIFGSALRPDFGPHSDIDFLITFKANSKRTLFDLTNMQDELQEIFGRGVDLVARPALEASRNYVRRKSILESAKTVYAA